jgi:glutamate-ammonia-ligase adenylyltransferase
VDDSIENLLRGLPDPPAALRFLDRLAELHPGHARKLSKQRGLLSDALALASFSPLLATTIEQNPEYLWWLSAKRSDSAISSKDDLLESLARFSLTHSELDMQVVLARFRRRELLRIFLRDIRRVLTTAEITEELSNLADAILEFALRSARQELENRFGLPLKIDDKGRSAAADACIVALGKLGSRELNYASDIDLMFIYSADGTTSDQGTRGQITNREYFIKLAERVIALVGRSTGEGAAYRVDLRLRPYGRVGSLAISVADALKYYKTEARPWERQVLIRSRSSAGNPELYRDFYSAIEETVFSAERSPELVLAAVREAKERIDSEQKVQSGFNVKLAKGGIREIEFIAQALQLANGGRDRWLRAAHTLISLSRLADRALISETELTELFNAYDFLRRLEHILQMENGLQTHTVPDEPSRRLLVSRRMNFKTERLFDRSLRLHSGNVSRIFRRVFGDGELPYGPDHLPGQASGPELQVGRAESSGDTPEIMQEIARVAPRYAGMLRSHPLPAFELLSGDAGRSGGYRQVLKEAASSAGDFGHQLSALRKRWTGLLLDIVAADVAGRLTLKDAKRRQTELAEATVDASLMVVKTELERRYNTSLTEFPLAVLGLGKLGGGGVDYDSDLDVILIYDEPDLSETGLTPAEFFSRAAEIFVTTLSGITRDGSLYRVDLRLRPFGKNGRSAISKDAFLEYVSRDAAIWELLAYVKLRAVSGDMRLGDAAEQQGRKIIHERALAIGRAELANETFSVRTRLEDQRGKTRGHGEVDIKYGSGGMLDIYFAARYLQLRDNVQDDAEHRATGPILDNLFENGSIAEDNYKALREGYVFFAKLDHSLRLIVGRTTRFPIAKPQIVDLIAERMAIGSASNLIDALTQHRLAVRDSFSRILSDENVDA